jgi:hypothetical protein
VAFNLEDRQLSPSAPAVPQMSCCGKNPGQHLEDHPALNRSNVGYDFRSGYRICEQRFICCYRFRFGEDFFEIQVFATSEIP